MVLRASSTVVFLGQLGRTGRRRRNLQRVLSGQVDIPDQARSIFDFVRRLPGRARLVGRLWNSVVCQGDGNQSTRPVAGGMRIRIWGLRVIPNLQRGFFGWCGVATMGLGLHLVDSQVD